MRQSSKVEGTKIAQAAKDLNVTSVTIRRYIAEFGIDTTSDENGIKVLPDQAMEELKEIRRLKEEGLTNPKVLEMLEDNRKKPPEKTEAKSKARKKAEPAVAAKAVREREPVEEEPEEVAVKPERKKTARRISKPEQVELPEIEEPAPRSRDDDDDTSQQEESDGEAQGDGKSKHSLTCQTCSKVFEHMNPRLRDCLECYRAKRKERRRGGADRHKNVIQHPIAQQVAAQQVANKAAQQGLEEEREPQPVRELVRERDRSADRERDRDRDRDRAPAAAAAAPFRTPAPPAMSQQISAPPPQQRTGVRNYRKAIEETRTITGSLKRRLERPDLPEGERRWLEQIYAYQLILHQGWRHLAEYRAATVAQGRGAHVEE